MLLDDLPGMAADATFSAEDDLLLPRTLTIFPRRIDSGTAFTDDQQSKGGAAPHELGQASPEHILELVDCALRLAICEKPLKLPSGIKITRDNVTRLATVAPALWRPHHLKVFSAKDYSIYHADFIYRPSRKGRHFYRQSLILFPTHFSSMQGRLR